MSNQPDVERVAATLADAFCDDPVMMWMFEDDDLRGEQLYDFWTFNVQQNPPTGRILVTANYESAAIWRAPMKAEPAGEGLSPFVALMVRLLGEETAYRKMSTLSPVGDAHPKTPHWYLPSVGTRVDSQGRGLGLQVLSPVLVECDAVGIPAYLESSNPRNIGFYERLGFASVGEYRIPDGPLFTFMWREPTTSPVVT